MMKIFISTLPGVGFACSFFLLLLGLVQLQVYRKKHYRRSLDISLFCILASIFAFEQFLVQSRMVSPLWTQIFVIFSSASYCFSLVFYMRALNYFVAVPGWVYRLFTVGASIIGGVVMVGLPYWAVTGKAPYFNPTKMVDLGNYFVNSYSMRLGEPLPGLTSLLFLAGLIVIVGSIVMLKNILKSSQDMYLMAGLVFSILATVKENFFLPFTFEVFVPVIFMASLFEAFRMNSLAYREYMRDKMDGLSHRKAPEYEKYQNSNLSEERVVELADKLMAFLTNEKLYMNPNLSSEELAKKIGIPTYQLSQVINIGLNTTFFELLSQCRIEEVKKRLADEEFGGETIINIAYNAGFNSKSAFNTAFKRQTGMTPSVFRKNHLSF